MVKFRAYPGSKRLKLIRCSGSGTYNFFQNVDLVEKHALLVVVHMALAKNLDGALGTRLSVHTHAHLTEGAFTGGQKLA